MGEYTDWKQRADIRYSEMQLYKKHFKDQS